MHEFWNNFIDNQTYIFYIKTKDIDVGIAKSVATSFVLQIKNQKDHYPEVNVKKVIGLMKDELDGTIMREFIALGHKLQSY